MYFLQINKLHGAQKVTEKLMINQLIRNVPSLTEHEDSMFYSKSPEQV